MTAENTISVEYLAEDGLYCAAWTPVAALGAGATVRAALEDLRGAMHYAVDCCISGRLEQGGPGL